MARSGYFAHESSNGNPFAVRVKRFYPTTGYRMWRAGETLLWASPDVDAKRALAMWLKSPEHRRVLLTPAWREIGVSAVHTPSGPRVFESLEVTVVTADFGARATIASAPSNLPAARRARPSRADVGTDAEPQNESR